MDTDTNGQSMKTTDHDKIKQWVEKRGGKPAVVKDTKKKGEGIGVLRIDFPGYSGKQSLEPVSWEDFFQTFDDKKLAFLYEENTENGEESRFFKFVRREE